MPRKHSARRGAPVPRGILSTGPAILSYGFRPFFLAAGVFAIVAMALWIGAIAGIWSAGGETYGAVHWHGHEMIFGYATAALAGFLLTAIPNWTGRFPLAGYPLLGLVVLWLAGRVAMFQPNLLGEVPTAAVDAAFLPLLALFAGREIVAGKNWKNLKILSALLVLSIVNLSFHIAVGRGGDAHLALRAGIAVFIVLIALVGGRIVPSFTRNWLVKRGIDVLPHPLNWFDKAAIATLVAALLVWLAAPEAPFTAFLCYTAALLQAVRLWRWRGHATVQEPLLLALHVAYAFIPLGLGAVAGAALGAISQTAAIHLLTVGAVAMMTMAVMARATRGHTGHQLTASTRTTLSFVALFCAALMRPLADIVPAVYSELLWLSGALWIIAYMLFVWEHAPMMTKRR